MRRVMMRSAGGGVEPPIVLCHFDSDFTDSQGLITFTNPNGYVGIDTATKQFGAGSASRTNTTSTLGLVPSSIEPFRFDNVTSRTIEMWLRNAASVGSESPIVGAHYSAGGTITSLNRFSWVLLQGTSNNWNLRCYSTAFAPYNVSFARHIDEFDHIAITRDGNSLYIHHDGVYQGAIDLSAFTMWTPDRAGLLGDIGTTAAGPYLHMDEFAVFDYAKYSTSNFTPPSAPY